jgi:hypothetical protein
MASANFLAKDSPAGRLEPYWAILGAGADDGDTTGSEQALGIGTLLAPFFLSGLTQVSSALKISW